MLSTSNGRRFLTKTFRLCEELEEKDSDQFVKWNKECWGTLAMIDYPNAANFLKSLPEYPIMEVCKRLKNPNVAPRRLMAQIYYGLSVYYNFTGDRKCNNISEELEAEDMLAWEYQVSYQFQPGLKNANN